MKSKMAGYAKKLTRPRDAIASRKHDDIAPLTQQNYSMENPSRNNLLTGTTPHFIKPIN
jgi:hypothetical protein